MLLSVYSNLKIELKVALYFYKVSLNSKFDNDLLPDIVINSHVDYSSLTVLPLVEQLKHIGFPLDKVHVVVCGATSGEQYLVDTTYVEYNLFDVSALFAVSQKRLRIQSEYVMLLHDTCTLSCRFIKALSTVFYNRHLTTSIQSFASGNIGIYSLDYLTDLLGYFTNEREIYEMDSIQSRKQRAVVTEDELFRRSPNHSVAHAPIERCIRYSKSHYAGRIALRYMNIDIVKHKANFIGQVERYITDLSDQRSR